MKKIFLFVIAIILCITLVGCGNSSDTKKEDKQVNIIDATVEYECHIGDTLNEFNKCIYRTQTVAAFRYKCPSGYTVYGNQCWKSGGVLNLSKCGANHVEVGGRCYINTIATMEYYCLSGTLSGTMCVSETEYEPTVSYSCPDGYSLTNNSRCQGAN